MFCWRMYVGGCIFFFFYRGRKEALMLAEEHPV